MFLLVFLVKILTMKYFYYLLIIVFVFSCKKETQKTTTSDIEDKAIKVDSSNTDISAISTKDFTEF